MESEQVQAEEQLKQELAWRALEKFLHELRETIPYTSDVPVREALALVERNRNHLGEFHALVRRKVYGL